MNEISISTKKFANNAAIFNLFLYLSQYYKPTTGTSFNEIIKDIKKHITYSNKDMNKLSILDQYCNNNTQLYNAILVDYIYEKNIIIACVFKIMPNIIYVIFKGTSSSEWIDNGEGLAGIKTATNQQLEALAWFYDLVYKYNLKTNYNIVVSGHSKGGNKAQFITMHSDLIDYCISFSGQGFSPEAINSFKNILGEKFYERNKKIFSFSSANDYVNVLGEQIVSEQNKYFFKANNGIHKIESILNQDGTFTNQVEQGRVSKYVEKISSSLMMLKPFARQYATISVMSIIQKYVDDGTAIDYNLYSQEDTIKSISETIRNIINI